MATEYKLLTPDEVMQNKYIKEVSCVEIVDPEKSARIVVMWQFSGFPANVELRRSHPRNNSNFPSDYINITLDELLIAMQMLAADQKARGLANA